jgi:hypothetical protein
MANLPVAAHRILTDFIILVQNLHLHKNASGCFTYLMSRINQTSNHPFTVNCFIFQHLYPGSRKINSVTLMIPKRLEHPAGGMVFVISTCYAIKKDIIINNWYGAIAGNRCFLGNLVCVE